MAPLIDVRNLTKTYSLGEVTVRALRGVTLTIERGSFVAVMGPSGSGKSTFMNLLGCLDRPTSGRYLLDGVPVESLDRDRLAEIRNRKIGFIFQTFNLLPRMTALENVELPLLYKSGEMRDSVALARRMLAAVGLGGREQSLPSQLSGGQQQLVAVARAVIAGPKLILADEPTGNLHSSQGKQIMDLFNRLNEEGATIIQVTHNEAWAAYGDRIIELADGWIVEGQAKAGA